MKRVFIYCPANKGGIYQYSCELAAHINQISPIASVITQKGESEVNLHTFVVPILESIVKKDNYKNSFTWALSRLFYYPKREIKFVLWLLENCRKGDIIHIQEFSPLSIWLTIIFAKLLGIRIVTTIHDIIPHIVHTSITHSISILLNKLCWKASDAVIIHSSDLSKHINFISPDKVNIIHHGVWTKGYPVPTYIDFLEKISGKSILVFGGIRRNKNIHSVIDAVSLNSKYTLTVAGPIIERDYYAKMIEPRISNQDKENINLIPRYIEEDELKDLFSHASVVILPYDSFLSQSGVLLMALSYFTPVIATEVGGMGDLLMKYRIGLPLQRVDSKTISNSLEDFSDIDPDMLYESILSARESLSWREAADMTVKLYEKISK